jgi:hypothetical protein
MKGFYRQAVLFSFWRLSKNIGDKNFNMLVRWEQLRQDGWYQLALAAYSREQKVSSNDG